MLVSKNWLTDYVDLPKNITPEQLLEDITVKSVEVEEIKDLAKSFEGIIVGEILEVKPHPNADKLQVAIVNDGKKQLNIVCGAPNIAAGQKVPLATLGTFMPALGFIIEEREMRGEKSQGMLCAADEIGMGTDHAGIMVLSNDLKAGQPLSKALGLEDWVLEVDNKSMTHRPDMWGHIGIAREVSAIYGTTFKSYQPGEIYPTKDDVVKIDVKNTDACLRYSVAVFSNIEIKESPDWVKARLAAVGQHSINNVVDATNYVLFEFGQPLHAFDFDTIKDSSVIVRNAKAGEKVTTLDDKEFELNKDDLVIADKDRALAIAGIKGLKNSGITNATSKIILESASFNHVTIRQTSQRLGLRTDSSARYEKGLDPNMTLPALFRAYEIIKETCPEVVMSSDLEDVQNFKLNRGPIKTSVEFINKKIGIEIPAKKIIEILYSLGFEVKGKDDLEVIIPSWRATKDVSIAEDLVEEVARIYGFDAIPSELPSIDVKRPEVNYNKVVIEKIKDLLAYGFDMSEVYAYSFIAEKLVKEFGDDPDTYVRIINPQAKGLELLRTNLIPNLLQEAILNTRFFDHFNLFEVGSTFVKGVKGLPINKEAKQFLPLQDKHVAGIVHDKGNKEPFYVVKNIVEGVLHRLHIDYDLAKPKVSPSWVDGNRVLAIVVDGKEVGILGELDKKMQKKFKLKERIGLFEINIEALVAVYSDQLKYSAIPKFPSIDMDVALEVDSTLEWQKVSALVLSLNKDIVRDVILFDVYQGEGVEAGRKSLAFRITYRSDDKTLETKEVDKVHGEIKKALVKELGGKIR